MSLVEFEIGEGLNPLSDDFNSSSNNPSVDPKEQKRAVEKIGHKLIHKPVLSTEDVKKSQELIIDIQRHVEHPRFSDHLSKYGFNISRLQEKSVGELQSLLTRIKTCISHKNLSVSFLGSGIFMGIHAIEMLIASREFLRANFDITGLSSVLRNDEKFADLIAELELNYNIVSDLSIEKRMALYMLESVISVVMENRTKGMTSNLTVRKQEIESKIKSLPPDAQAKYKMMSEQILGKMKGLSLTSESALRSSDDRREIEEPEEIKEEGLKEFTFVDNPQPLRSSDDRREIDTSSKVLSDGLLDLTLPEDEMKVPPDSESEPFEIVQINSEIPSRRSKKTPKNSVQKSTV
jgi:hypothetical protein